MFGVFVSEPGRCSVAEDRYVTSAYRPCDHVTKQLMSSNPRPCFSSSVLTLCLLPCHLIHHVSKLSSRHLKAGLESNMSCVLSLHRFFSDFFCVWIFTNVLLKNETVLSWICWSKLSACYLFPSGELRNHGNSDCCCASILALFHNRLLTFSQCVYVCVCEALGFLLF